MVTAGTSLSLVTRERPSHLNHPDDYSTATTSIVLSFPIIPSSIIQITIITIPVHSRITPTSFPSTSSTSPLLSLVPIPSPSSSTSTTS